MQHGRTSRNNETENWADLCFAKEPDYINSAKKLSLENEIQQIALSAHEGKLLSLLFNLSGLKKIVEVGTLYAYSALWIAKNLPESGEIFTLEGDKKNYVIAKENIDRSPHKEKIHLIFGDARDMLQTIENNGPFDGMFIDAMKFDYEIYLNWAEKNVRKGGLIIGDNTYMFGKLHMDPSQVLEEERSALKAMRNFNRRLADPEKYESVLIPTGEGMTVAKKLF